MPLFLFRGLSLDLGLETGTALDHGSKLELVLMQQSLRREKKCFLKHTSTPYFLTQAQGYRCMHACMQREYMHVLASVVCVCEYVHVFASVV